VNRGDQGPVLLAVAGTLLLLAVVAYTIGDADSVAQRRDAFLRTGEALKEQAERLSEDRRILNAEMHRLNNERSTSSSRQEAIMESLSRLERKHLGATANVVTDAQK
jgi:cell division protein FtsB